MESWRGLPTNTVRQVVDFRSDFTSEMWKGPLLHSDIISRDQRNVFTQLALYPRHNHHKFLEGKIEGSFMTVLPLYSSQPPISAQNALPKLFLIKVFSIKCTSGQKSNLQRKYCKYISTLEPWLALLPIGEVETIRAGSGSGAGLMIEPSASKVHAQPCNIP